MPKRDREHWGSLVPHNSLCGRRPVPLCSPTIVIGKDGDVTAPHNPHLSKHHIRLERVDDGSVYATHLSALNDTWLNGAKLERDRRTLVVPCAGNAPFSLRGEAPDAPLLFVSVPHAEAGRAGVQDKKLNGWCGWSLRLLPAGDKNAAPAGSSAAPSAEPHRSGALAISSRDGGHAAVVETEPAGAALALAEVEAEAQAAEAQAAEAEWCSEEPRTRQTVFRGVRLLVATRLCKQVQEGVVRRGGGEVVGGVQEATHVTLECHRRAEELLSLKTIPRDEWPRLVTQEWVGQCSKVLSADGTRTGVLRMHLHPDAVERREPPSPASPASSPPFLPDPRPAVAHPADPPAAAVDSGREGGSGGGSDDPNEVAIIDGREHRWVPAASGAPESRLWPGGFTRLTEFRNCAGLEWVLRGRDDTSARRIPRLMPWEGPDSERQAAAQELARSFGCFRAAAAPNAAADPAVASAAVTAAARVRAWNARVAEPLWRMAGFIRVEEEGKTLEYHALAYENAARAVERSLVAVTSGEEMARRGGYAIKSGSGMEAHINEILDSLGGTDAAEAAVAGGEDGEGGSDGGGGGGGGGGGSFPRLSEKLRSPHARQWEAVAELIAVKWVGRGLAQRLWKAGATGLASLQEQYRRDYQAWERSSGGGGGGGGGGGAAAGAVMGVLKNSEAARVCLHFHDDIAQRIPRAEAEACVALLKRACAAVYGENAVEVWGPCGSYRRGAASSHDLDVIIVRASCGGGGGDSGGDSGCGGYRTWLDESEEDGGGAVPLLPLLEHLEKRGFLAAHLQVPWSNNEVPGRKAAHSAPPPAKHRRGDVGYAVAAESKGDGRKARRAERPQTYMGVLQPKGAADGGGGGSGGVARRIDIKSYARCQLPFALIYFTGGTHFNRSLRLLAKELGYTLSDQGLAQCKRSGDNNSGPRVWTGPSLAAATEEEVFAALGVPYCAPECRDDARLAALGPMPSPAAEPEDADSGDELDRYEV